jgi:hypothetical protein
VNEISAFAELIEVDRDELAPVSSREAASTRLEQLIFGATPKQSHFHFPRRAQTRLALVFLILTVLIAVGWIASQRFDLNLFDANNAPPAPTDLSSLLGTEKGQFAVDTSSLATVATFTSARGSTTLYMARMVHGAGVDSVYLNDGKVMSLLNGGLDEIYWWPEDYGTLGQSLFVYSTSLKGVLSGADGTVEIIGITPDSASRVEVRFRDGTSETVPLHDGLFGYIAGGRRCQAGHEPDEVVALDAGGQIVGRQNAFIKPGCND